MQRSFETGQSQVAIVNEALENFFAQVAPKELESPSTVSSDEGNVE
jgi:hypothetical protein